MQSWTFLAGQTVNCAHCSLGSWADHHISNCSYQKTPGAVTKFSYCFPGLTPWPNTHMEIQQGNMLTG